jgi:hypothetical protein
MENRTRRFISPSYARFFIPRMEKRARLPRGRRDAHFCMPRTLHTLTRRVRREGRDAGLHGELRRHDCQWPSGSPHSRPQNSPLVPSGGVDPAGIEGFGADPGQGSRAARINYRPSGRVSRSRPRAAALSDVHVELRYGRCTVASARVKAEWRTRRPDRSAQFREHGMACRRGATSRSCARRERLMTSRHWSLR